MPKIEPSIFKAYDIRGTYPDQLNEEGGYLIARGYATLLRSENPGKDLTVAVGMDMRLSSPQLKESIVQGLRDSGVNVEDIGLVSTPTYYFATAFHAYDGGIQVSASHNPAHWNGLKMVRAGGAALSRDSGILTIRDMVEKDELAPRTEPGRLTSREGVTEEAAAELLKDIPLGDIRKFRIVVDPANAMGALDIAAMFRHIPGELIAMNFELDGSFPAHEADPMKEENLRSIGERIRAEGADLGIAPDGDGDRYFIVDEKGEMVPPHILRGVLAQVELAEHPGATVAYDIRPGRITQDMIEEHGGRAIVTPVGHSLIKEMMVREGAIFGGESSGHFYYKRPFGTFEMPAILIAKFLTWFSAQGKPLSEAIAPYKKYAHSGEINFKLADRGAIERKVEEVKNVYSGGQQAFVDGVSVTYPNFWFNVRAANTEPLLRLTVEAKDKETLDIETEKLKTLITN